MPTLNQKSNQIWPITTFQGPMLAIPVLPYLISMATYLYVHHDASDTNFDPRWPSRLATFLDHWGADPFPAHRSSIILYPSSSIHHGVSLFRTFTSFLRLCGSSSFIQVCNSSSLFQTSLFDSVNHQVFFDCMRPICLLAPHLPFGAPFAFWRPICLLGAPFAFWRPIPSDVQLQYLWQQVLRSSHFAMHHHPHIFWKSHDLMLGSQKGPSQMVGEICVAFRASPRASACDSDLLVNYCLGT